MKNLLRIFLLICILVASPFVWYSAVGLYRGYDVAHAWKALLAGDPTGRTIAAADVPVIRKPVVWQGDIENHRLNEASGLAWSSRKPGVLFAVNDSGNEPEIFAMDEEGRDLGYWRVDVPENTDWEDLSSFRWQGEDYLLIADTGDNFLWRPVLYLYVVREPDVTSLAVDEVLPVEWRIAFTWPNGYRDCEAVSVDQKSGSVLLLSKRVIPAEVYRVPLRPAKSVVQAVRMALLHNIPQPDEGDLWESRRFGKFRSRPTALDIHENKAVVVTYKDAYLFRKPRRGSWIDAFAGIPERIPLPGVFQQEAGALTPDGKFLYVTTEREDGTNRAGLFRVQL